MTEEAKTPNAKFWCGEIATYEQKFNDWESRSKKIIDRYADKRGPNARKKSLYNILWSNVQTLAPALYANQPKPNIDRRYQDDNELGLATSRILERSVSYFVDNDLFNDVMNQVVLDRLLPGRGQGWVRYVPSFKQAPAQTTDDVSSTEELAYEDVVIDYVNWPDFGHTWGRTWQEVRAVWRKVYMGRAELVKRFGENGQKIPLGDKPKDDGTPYVETNNSKACIYEIWDKQNRKAMWLHKDIPDMLDEQEDPLKLKDFFPCPKPVYATLTNENLIPTPDYIQYQDQANELDMLTGRIEAITKAIKVAGVYDKSAEGVQRMLTENVENALIPIEQWAVFGEKGGLKGVVDYFPVEMLMKVVAGLYEAREKVKQDLYEITGLSDIIRGATDANETATAQEIKGKFATLRLDHMQKDVARFSRDLVRIMAEIIAEHFSIDTIKKISGIRLLTEQEKQGIIAKQEIAEQQAQQTGQPPAPLPDDVQELMDQPTWEEVEGVIRDDMPRSFMISIETDSTIKADQEAEKAARTEFLQTAGTFMQGAVMMPPELQPLAMEMLLFGVRGFKVSRDIENTFKDAMQKVKKNAENPQPQADPNAAEIEKEKIRVQADEKIEGAKIQSNERIEGAKIASNEKIEAIKVNADVEKHRVSSEDDVKKSRMEAKTKVTPDMAMSDPDFNEGETPMAQVMAQFSQTMLQGFQQLAMMQQQGNQAVIEAISAPKQVIRDAKGQIAGVQTIQ